MLCERILNRDKQPAAPAVATGPTPGPAPATAAASTGGSAANTDADPSAAATNAKPEDEQPVEAVKAPKESVVSRLPLICTRAHLPPPCGVRWVAIILVLRSPRSFGDFS